MPKELICLGEVVATFENDPDDLDHPYGAGVRIISFAEDGAKYFAEYIKSLEKLYLFHWPPELKELQQQQEKPAEEKKVEEEIEID